MPIYIILQIIGTLAQILTCTGVLMAMHWIYKQLELLNQKPEHKNTTVMIMKRFPTENDNDYLSYDVWLTRDDRLKVTHCFVYIPTRRVFEYKGKNKDHVWTEFTYKGYRDK